MAFFSALVTPKTVKQLLMVNKPHIKAVTQVSVLVRSMGTATYLALGGSDAQDRRLTTVGDSISIDIPLGQDIIDLSTIFVSSDTADGVLEIFGETRS